MQPETFPGTGSCGATECCYACHELISFARALLCSWRTADILQAPEHPPCQMHVLHTLLCATSFGVKISEAARSIIHTTDVGLFVKDWRSQNSLGWKRECVILSEDNILFETLSMLYHCYMRSTLLYVI